MTACRPLAGLVLAAAACTGTTSPPAGPPIDPVTAIEAAYQRYDGFIRRVEGDSIAALYTADGEMVGTGARGPAQIAAFLAQFKRYRVEAAGHETDAITVADSLAIHWGRYHQRAVVDGKSYDVSGRFVIEWHHGADGRWLVRRLLTVPDPPKS